MTIYPDRQDDVQMTWGAIKPKIGEMWTDGNYVFVILKHSPYVVGDRQLNEKRFDCYFPQLEQEHPVYITSCMTRVDGWVS